jgi:1-pyrroline-5-carboxylate dehydrogenase
MLRHIVSRNTPAIIRYARTGTLSHYYYYCSSSQRRTMASTSIPSWANYDPNTVGRSQRPVQLQNLVNGTWQITRDNIDIIDPLNGATMFHMPNTHEDELEPFIESMKRVPKSGVHNVWKKPERFLMYGDISARAAEKLADPDIAELFVRAIQRVVPKSAEQAFAEVRVTRQFLRNFSGDQVRFLSRGFSVPGDHSGQVSHGHRWPFGAVAIIAPFNFPLEIPALQLMGALYMGNKPVIKGAEIVSSVLELFVRLLHHVGMPADDVDVLHSSGRVMNKLLLDAPMRMTQFTGSSRVAEKLANELHGKIRLEDAGFDWKILGPDVASVDYVSHVCDTDAYACSGQKCSAQSILFAHENWSRRTPLFDNLKRLAARRNLDDLTVAPVMTVTTDTMLQHAQKLLSIPGSRVLFGATELKNHTIPKVYGAIEPTAIFVPLEEMLKPENFDTCTHEIFGPFQVVTEYSDSQVPLVIEACERMSHHLTAAIVSNDPTFTNRILANTVNGTTYAGIRARTTGAPQNHWFGPAGDPRGAGIGTPEAIKLVWSCHREVIFDQQAVPADWKTPHAT